MCQADFPNIHLLPEENRALFRYSRLSRVPEDDPHLPTFKHLGFVRLEGAVKDKTGVMRGGWYVISTEGRRYLEYLKDRRNDRWWTRGLAIAAIIISLIALLLEMDDRGFLGGVLDGFRTSRNVTRTEESVPQD